MMQLAKPNTQLPQTVLKPNANVPLLNHNVTEGDPLIAQLQKTQLSVNDLMSHLMPPNYAALNDEEHNRKMSPKALMPFIIKDIRRNYCPQDPDMSDFDVFVNFAKL